MGTGHISVLLHSWDFGLSQMPCNDFTDTSGRDLFVRIVSVAGLEQKLLGLVELVVLGNGKWFADLFTSWTSRARVSVGSWFL